MQCYFLDIIIAMCFTIVVVILVFVRLFLSKKLFCLKYMKMNSFCDGSQAVGGSVRGVSDRCLCGRVHKCMYICMYICTYKYAYVTEALCFVFRVSLIAKVMQLVLPADANMILWQIFHALSFTAFRKNQKANFTYFYNPDTNYTVIYFS